MSIGCDLFCIRFQAVGKIGFECPRFDDDHVDSELSIVARTLLPPTDQDARTRRYGKCKCGAAKKNLHGK